MKLTLLLVALATTVIAQPATNNWLSMASNSWGGKVWVASIRTTPIRYTNDMTRYNGDVVPLSQAVAVSPTNARLILVEELTPMFFMQARRLPPPPLFVYQKNRLTNINVYNALSPNSSPNRISGKYLIGREIEKK